MIVDCLMRIGDAHWLSAAGFLYDDVTGEILLKVYRFNTETGEYWYWKLDDKGNYMLNEERTAVLRGYGRREKLKFVPRTIDNPNAEYTPPLSESKINFREFL